MGLYDEQLNQLLEQCSKKKKLRAKEKELRAQQDSFAARAKELARIAQKEQADVDRLEGHSLSAFFYNMLGKTEEKWKKSSGKPMPPRSNMTPLSGSSMESSGICAGVRKN